MSSHCMNHEILIECSAKDQLKANKSAECQLFTKQKPCQIIALFGVCFFHPVHSSPKLFIKMCSNALLTVCACVNDSFSVLTQKCFLFYYFDVKVAKFWRDVPFRHGRTTTTNERKQKLDDDDTNVDVSCFALIMSFTIKNFSSLPHFIPTGTGDCSMYYMVVFVHCGQYWTVHLCESLDWTTFAKWIIIVGMHTHACVALKKRTVVYFHKHTTISLIIEEFIYSIH